TLSRISDLREIVQTAESQAIPNEAVPYKAVLPRSFIDSQAALEMLFRLVVIFWICVSAECQCPPDFELVIAGECRKSENSDGDVYLNKAVDEATKACAKFQSTVASIHTDEELAYWNPSNAMEYRELVLGLTCNNQTNKWEWLDKTTVDVKPPVYDDALDEECATGCTWYYGTNWNGHEYLPYWSLNCRSFMDKVCYACTVSLPPLPEVPTGDNCEAFDEDDDDGLCYLVGKATNWNDARMSCQSLGAELASIHSDEENAFIRRLAVSNGAVNGIYLGGKATDWDDKNYYWIDGSNWDFTKFYPGYPMSGFGECLAMDTSTKTGEWMNTNWHTQLPVACSRSKKPVPKPTCNPGPLQGAGYVSSPGFPFSSSMPCDYFLSVEEEYGYKVQVEIILLEANSCCDRLILYEGNLGGNVIANLTGSMTSGTYTTKASNIIRVSWQPQGGVNVRGMSIFFHGV
ncbi:hypothetical protein PMAYCL1PPCAC_25954, partial [Pristionchus mayeri]